MAQLKDDCFAFGGELMPLANALEQLKARVGAVTGTETVALRDAIGRILAEDLIASLDVPPLDNSAVDGYAVYSSDLEAAGETRLLVTGRIAAGHPLGRPAERGPPDDELDDLAVERIHGASPLETCGLCYLT